MMQSSPTLAPLSRSRHALLRALRAGATPEQAAEIAGWSPERVRREAIAAVETLAPPLEPELEPEDRRRIAATLLLGGAGDAVPAHGRAWAERAADALQRVAPAAPPAAAPPPGVPERPALAEGVVIEPPAPAADYRVVHAAQTRTYLRVKLAQAALLESLNGSRTVAEIERAGTVPQQIVRPLLARFASLGLLAGTERADAEERAKRLRGRAAAAVTLKVADPGPLLERARPLLRRLASPAAMVAVAALAVAACVALVARTGSGLLGGDRLSDPVLLATVAAAMVVTAVVHELGHATAVTVLGGRVRRMGVMLFYLFPALFCDTSDAWRFPYRRQRVAVAFGGMVAQVALVALACQALWLPLGESARAWLLVYALANAGMLVTNLVPLVKLDGYWALAGGLDRPNLRANAIGRAGAWARRLAFGEPVGRRDPHEAALVAFGAASALFAPALLIYALLRWHDVLLDAGAVGATVWVLLLLVVAGRPLAAGGRALAARLSASERRVRSVLVGVVLPLALVAGLLLVPMRTSVSGRFDRAGQPAGRAVVTVEGAGVRPGARAELGPRSPLSGHRAARGTVVRAAGGDRFVVAFGAGARLERSGDATVRSADRPAGAWLWSHYAVSTARALGF